MRNLALVLAGLGLAGLGVVVGSVVGSGGPAEVEAPQAEVLVRDDSGDLRALSPEEAAARIESLESLVQRRERRYGSRADTSVQPEQETEEDDLMASLRVRLALVHPEGRPYTTPELRELALSSDDPVLRASAIRALRGDDSDEARATLQAVLSDGEAPKEVRLLAAQMLVRWPHRDHLPEELIEALSAETDPEIRLELTRGVTSLRARAAYMKEISELFREETDPSVRAALLRTLSQARRDPAARAELLHVATTPTAPAKERLAALRALTAGRPDADTVAMLEPLLKESDPAVRASALRILTSNRAMPLGTLRAGLADEDPSVRVTALAYGMHHTGRYWKDKKVDNALVKQTWGTVADLARSDPNADVRRAAVNSTGRLPKSQRNDVLTSAREDSDPFVRLTAYARSGGDIARTATQDFVGALASPDARLRTFAYRQLQRLHAVKEPYSGRWNDEARAEATQAIQREIAAGQTR